MTRIGVYCDGSYKLLKQNDIATAPWAVFVVEIPGEYSIRRCSAGSSALPQMLSRPMSDEDLLAEMDEEWGRNREEYREAEVGPVTDSELDDAWLRMMEEKEDGVWRE